MGTQRLIFVALTLVTLLFGWRAVEGWWRGLAYIEGTRAVEEERYKEGIDALAHGAFGADKATALWFRAQGKLRHWQRLVAEQKPEEETNAMLVETFQDYTEALALSPSCGWYWVDLADVYHLWDGFQRLEQGNLLSLVGFGPWAYVGHQGRVALGLAEVGIEMEPTTFSFRDRLALMYLNYELEEPALEIIRESARIQPLYYVHDWGNPQYLAPPIYDAFVQGAREGLGNTPMMRRGLHQLALGRLEVRRGNYAIGEKELRAALELPGHDLNRADAHYFLGLALLGQEKLDEAWEAFELSKAHENTRKIAIAQQAKILTQRGDLEGALEIYQTLRRLEPRTLQHVLDYVDIAARTGREDQALEALRWGLTLDAKNGGVHQRLAMIHAQRGDTRLARKHLEEFETITGRPMPQMRQMIESAADGER